ncbi:TFIIB zinc-binding protein [Pyrobaculum oguniense TE7]|uniref:TFIIB zinc-binding protein n=1 Tax=Pyrobaculum oguniense (strain DSM 13380 / JCM 10595 / TE7) TaxID=698757 RepID=H6QDC2_PYROT|nr:TFIIB zinc-binding protein [Pyrobaculum oguniense TE7]
MSCPRCGSREVMLTPVGEYVCKKCGHRWAMPSVDYTWIELDVKKAKLFEKYIDSPIESCEELLSLLLKELDEESARYLAAKILLQRAERRRMTPAELKKLYDNAESCFK